MAWAHVGQDTEIIQYAFKKCRISVAIDGSEDTGIIFVEWKGTLSVALLHR